MTTSTMRNDATIEDMNGPLHYWGPAIAPMPARPLRPADELLLRRLRSRLQSADDAGGLTAALSTLLAAPQRECSAA